MTSIRNGYVKKTIYNKNSNISNIEFNNILFYKDNFLAEDFIEKYQEQIYWRFLIMNQKLSEDIIEKYQDKYEDEIEWGYISLFQNLSESFIERYKDKLNWDALSKYQKLSNKFIAKYLNKLTSIHLNHCIDQEKLQVLIEKINLLR